MIPNILYKFFTFLKPCFSFHFSFHLLSQQSARFVNIPTTPCPTALFIHPQGLANTLTYEYTNFSYKINKDRRERRQREGAWETTRMNDNVCDVELTSPWGTISIIRPQTTHTEENPNICSNMEQFLCRDNSRGQRWVRHVRAQTTSNMLVLQVLLCRRKQTNKHTVIMTLFMHLHKKGKIYQNVEPKKKKIENFSWLFEIYVPKQNQ